MLRKIAVLFLVLCTVFSFVGCKQEGGEPGHDLARKEEEIRKGAVVLAKDLKGNYIIHRVIRREGDIVTLMGDGNIGLTEQAEVKDIIARMYSVKRKGRTYGTDGLIWRLYSWFWMLITPVKRYPLALWRRLNPQKPLR